MGAGKGFVGDPSAGCSGMSDLHPSARGRPVFDVQTIADQNGVAGLQSIRRLLNCAPGSGRGPRITVIPRCRIHVVNLV